MGQRPSHLQTKVRICRVTDQRRKTQERRVKRSPWPNDQKYPKQRQRVSHWKARISQTNSWVERTAHQRVPRNRIEVWASQNKNESVNWVVARKKLRVGDKFENTGGWFRKRSCHAERPAQTSWRTEQQITRHYQESWLLKDQTLRRVRNQTQNKVNWARKRTWRKDTWIWRKYSRSTAKIRRVTSTTQKLLRTWAWKTRKKNPRRERQSLKALQSHGRGLWSQTERRITTQRRRCQQFGGRTEAERSPHEWSPTVAWTWQQSEDITDWKLRKVLARDKRVPWKTNFNVIKCNGAAAGQVQWGKEGAHCQIGQDDCGYCF